MVAHEIGIFGKIDGFEGESSQPLTAVDGFVLGGGGASASRLRTPFSVHLILSLPLSLALAVRPKFRDLETPEARLWVYEGDDGFRQLWEPES